MGFYDHRCALTGLSLLGQRCDLLLLRVTSGRVEPLWGAVTGPYNRLGTIDDAPDHARDVALLSSSWDDLVAAGRLTHAGDAVAPAPFFDRFEPNRHIVKIDGHPVDVTLFHHRIITYLVEEHEPPDDVDELFRRAFPQGTALTATAPDGVASGLRRLVALRHHLGSRPFPRLGNAAQHGPDDVARSIRDARKRAPALREAIDRAEAEDYGPRSLA